MCEVDGVESLPVNFLILPRVSNVSQTFVRGRQQVHFRSGIEVGPRTTDECVYMITVDRLHSCDGDGGVLTLIEYQHGTSGGNDMEIVGSPDNRLKLNTTDLTLTFEPEEGEEEEVCFSAAYQSTRCAMTSNSSFIRLHLRNDSSATTPDPPYETTPPSVTTPPPCRLFSPPHYFMVTFQTASCQEADRQLTSLTDYSCATLHCSSGSMEGNLTIWSDQSPNLDRLQASFQRHFNGALVTPMSKKRVIPKDIVIGSVGAVIIVLLVVVILVICCRNKFKSRVSPDARDDHCVVCVMEAPPDHVREMPPVNLPTQPAQPAQPVVQGEVLGEGGQLNVGVVGEEAHYHGNQPHYHGNQPAQPPPCHTTTPQGQSAIPSARTEEAPARSHATPTFSPAVSGARGQGARAYPPPHLLPAPFHHDPRITPERTQGTTSGPTPLHPSSGRPSSLELPSCDIPSYNALKNNPQKHPRNLPSQFYGKQITPPGTRLATPPRPCLATPPREGCVLSTSTPLSPALWSVTEFAVSEGSEGTT